MASYQPMNLEGKISNDGKGMDLGLLGIKDIPVKQIAVFKRVTKLDLSNNHIREIPKEFCQQLTQLERLDFSRNLLERIPANFGDLSRLKHLDLFANKIQGVPLSFSKLSKLRWLDLKENPLKSPVSEVVGTCLTTTECEAAAQNLVAYLAHVEKKMIENSSNAVKESVLNAELEKKQKYSGPQKKKRGDPDFSCSTSSLLCRSILLNSTELERPDMLGNKGEDLQDAKPTKTESDYTCGYNSTQRVIPALEKNSKIINAHLTNSVNMPKIEGLDKKLQMPYTVAGLSKLSINWLVRVSLFIFFSVFTLSITLAMVADYRVIRDDIEYFFGLIFTNASPVNNFILKLQTSVEPYIQFQMINFPVYPYVEKNLLVLFWMWLSNTFSLIADFILNVISQASVYAESAWSLAKDFVMSWY